MFGETYRITDYFSLDPSWGPPAAFKHMVERAHALGIHVLIDFVPNHTSVRYPYYVDAQRYGKASHYYAFYDRDAQGLITDYTDIFNDNGDLPNLNYDNPEVRRMIIEASLYWIRTYGIDGCRVDAAWGVERRRPSYWAEWRAAIKRVDPDVLLLAEASAIDRRIFRGFPQDAGALLRPAITNAPRGYPRKATIMRFLDNNDSEFRFVDEFDAALTRVAATLQFTLPGVPEMFAGDEIGASYQPYSNLTPITWKDRFKLRPLYTILIRLRHTEASLTSRVLDLLQASPDSTFAYVRPASGGGPPVLVLLNFGRKTTMSIRRTAALDAFAVGTPRDLLTEHAAALRFQGSLRAIH